MLLRFSVENFRSFKDRQSLHLTTVKTCKEWLDENTGLEAGARAVRTAVIYGANASGKTNLFLAMQRMRAFMLASVDLDKQTQFLFGEPFVLGVDSVKNPGTFEIEFTTGNRRFIYGFSLQIKTGTPAEFEVSKEWLFEKKKVVLSHLFLRERKTGKDGTIRNIISINPKTMPGGAGLETRTRPDVLFFTVAAQFAEPTCQMISTYIRGSINVISGVDHTMLNTFSRTSFQTDADMAARIRKLIGDADTGVKDIVLGDNGMLVSRHSVYDASGSVVGRIDLPFSMIESQGTQKLFDLSGALIDTLRNGKVLVVDEFDAKLHPVLVRRLVELFNSSETNPKNAQLVFNTQSPDLLGYKVQAGNGKRKTTRLRRDQFYFVEKDNREASKVFSLIEYKDGRKTGVRNDSSYEKDYLSGLYGGIPFVAELFDGGR